MPTTIIGIGLGLYLMVVAIIQTSHQDMAQIKTVYDLYVNLPSFYLVFGGTLASTLIAHPVSHLIRGIKAFVVVFFKFTEHDFVKKIEEVCEFSQIYSKNGLPGLEEKLKSYKYDNMLKDGLNMIVQGYKLEEVNKSLETGLDRRYDREMIDYYVFKTMGAVAPAYGMVGTLVGLIFMLRVMGDSPEKIGPFLAVALVTTLYGLILAHLVFNPISNKLQHQAEINLRLGVMEIEGLKYVLEKQHPIYIKDNLASFIAPAVRKRLYKTIETKGK